MSNAMRRIGSVFVLSLGGCVALAACGTSNVGAPESAEGTVEDMEPVTISLADVDPEGSPSGQALAEFASEVEEKTDGKITFETYYSASLMPGEEMLSGIGTGTAGMGHIVTSYFPSELPVANWLLGLGSSSSDSFPQGMLQGAASTHEAYQTIDELKDEFATHNITPLFATVPSQQYDMLCTTPVESLSDAHGLRVRTPGQPWIDEVESIGMVAVQLPVNETYEGLQRGVVDCVVLHVASHIDFSLWDVAPYYVPVSLSQFNGIVYGINTDIWSSLPQDAQEIMVEAAHSAWMSRLSGGLERYAQFAEEGPGEHGLVFEDPRQLDPEISAHQQSVRDELVASAPDTVADPEELIQTYLDTQDEWLTVVSEDLDMPPSERDADSIRTSFADASELDLSEFANLTKQRLFASPAE